MSPPDPTCRERWSDKQLEAFHQEFLNHEAKEEVKHAQLTELYEAVFRKEDPDRGQPPGLLQLCARMSNDLTAMKIANDRQKRFIGGMVFAITSMGFFLTDTFHKIVEILRRL